MQQLSKNQVFNFFQTGSKIERKDPCYTVSILFLSISGCVGVTCLNTCLTRKLIARPVVCNLQVLSQEMSDPQARNAIVFSEPHNHPLPYLITNRAQCSKRELRPLCAVNAN